MLWLINKRFRVSGGYYLAMLSSAFYSHYFLYSVIGDTILFWVFFPFGFPLASNG